MYSTLAISRLSWPTSRRTAGLGEVELAAVRRAHDEDDRRVGVVAERVAQQVAGRRSLSEALSVKPAAFRCCSTSWPTAIASRAKSADRREDELRVLPGEVGDAVHGAAEPYQNSK